MPSLGNVLNGRNYAVNNVASVQSNGGVTFPRLDSAIATSSTNTLYALGTNSGLIPAFSPVGKYLWKDHLAFGSFIPFASYESWDGTDWNSATLDKNPFAGKQSAGPTISNGTTALGGRWTWNSGNFGYSNITWWLIGFGYAGATAPIKNIVVESSANGTVWTTRHNTVGNNTSAAPVALYQVDFGGDTWVRLTIQVTNAQPCWVTHIRALSSRWGNQGGSVEHEFPYSWDADRRITIGAGTANRSNGALNIGPATPTAASDGIYFGNDTNLYRKGAGRVATDGFFNGASLGSGEAFRVGDDASLWDVNTADTINVRSIATPANGKITFGSGNDTNIYRATTGTLKTDGILQIQNGLQLTNGTTNAINWGTTGVGAPGASSAGLKLKLYGTQGAAMATADYGVGIESNFMWFNGAAYKWYVGTALRATLDSTGKFFPVGGLDGGGQKITNVATPTTGTDAATKAYVDSISAPSTLQDNWHVFGAAGEPTFASGFSAKSGVQAPSFQKDPIGIVTLRGSVAVSGATTANTLISTLPAAYRPTATRTFFVGTGHSISTLNRVDVLANGEMRLMLANPEAGWFALDGITFDTNQTTVTVATNAINTVSALPGTPYNGQEIYYQNSTLAALGVRWHLIYNAASASAYKWEYLGGSNWRYNAGTITSVTNLTLNNIGSTLTVPLAGEYETTISSYLLRQNGSGGGYLGIQVYSGATSKLSAVASNSTAFASGAYSQNNIIFAASEVLQMKYQQASGTNADFYDVSLLLKPIRVG